MNDEAGGWLPVSHTKYFPPSWTRLLNSPTLLTHSMFVCEQLPCTFVSSLCRINNLNMMSINLYNDIIKTIQNNNIRDCQEVLEGKYPTVPFMTLGSLLSNYVQRRMKATHSKHNTPENIDLYYKRFQQAVAAREESGIILRLSDEIGITPVLTARFILEGYLRQLQAQYDKQQNEVGSAGEAEQVADAMGDFHKKKIFYNFGNMRTEITRLLRNSNLIEDQHVAYEVYLCLVHDNHYGPCPDIIKRTVGSEYEMILMKQLDEKKISYLDEKQLRLLGYDKTPDFKLDIPIGIEGRVVNWIESKATFGDEVTHQTYLNEQLTCYFNR
ncbi:hypothetical protein Fcan01_05978 [Folsomia candida]|uniref:CDAN1-interacting nuclease 1 n=1 Tax=Folsomia candida TaxID=158441 RepID=A0A226ET85_FOLCA|nr:hypothetical protein Fcan01_05978 [Folsomia candida]